jgi:hypothetical protein
VYADVAHDRPASGRREEARGRDGVNGVEKFGFGAGTESLTPFSECVV